MKLQLFFLVFICGSCVVQKRHFQPGWDVQWKKQYLTTNDNYKINRIEKSTTENEISLTSIDAFSQTEALKSENSSVKESSFNEGIENFHDNFLNADQACQLEVKQHQEKIVKRINLKEVTRKVKLKDSSENNSWMTFWYILILSVLLLGGIALLIFGSHWSLIVLGILALAVLVANLIFWICLLVFVDNIT